ncbi:hypothetical protein B447_15556 [Thauera sp. 27]|nr:hypothetical protein B447_15556 [Thauera sp. 27]
MTISREHSLRDTGLDKRIANRNAPCRTDLCVILSCGQDSNFLKTLSERLSLELLLPNYIQ